VTARQGDTLAVYQKESSGWWQGGLDGKIGFFPSDYVAVADGSRPIPVELLEKAAQIRKEKKEQRLSRKGEGAATASEQKKKSDPAGDDAIIKQLRDRVANQEKEVAACEKARKKVPSRSLATAPAPPLARVGESE
jgi:hypothetical protein